MRLASAVLPGRAAGLGVALLAGGLLLTGSGCASRAGRPGGPPSLVRASEPPPLAKVAQDNYGRLLLPVGSIVVVEGDQTAYAPATPFDRKTAPAINGVDDARLPDAWPIRLSQRLRRQVQVVEAVHPDDLASDGLSRWSTTPPGDVTIIMYGANEATQDPPVTDAAFVSAMQTLSNRARANGGWVVFVVPPPFPDRGLNASLGLYRAVVHLFAEQPNTMLFDPAKVLAETPGAYASKRRLSDAGQRAIGDALSALFLIVPRTA